MLVYICSASSRAALIRRDTPRVPGKTLNPSVPREPDNGGELNKPRSHACSGIRHHSESRHQSVVLPEIHLWSESRVRTLTSSDSRGRR